MASGTIPEPVHSTENQYGTSVDLTGYTSTRYEVPQHGYLYIRNTSSNNGYFLIYGETGNVSMRSGGAVGAYFNYVRKGMKVSFSGTSTAAFFVPLQ